MRSLSSLVPISFGVLSVLAAPSASAGGETDSTLKVASSRQWKIQEEAESRYQLIQLDFLKCLGLAFLEATVFGEDDEADRMARLASACHDARVDALMVGIDRTRGALGEKPLGSAELRRLAISRAFSLDLNGAKSEDPALLKRIEQTPVFQGWARFVIDTAGARAQEKE